MLLVLCLELRNLIVDTEGSFTSPTRSREVSTGRKLNHETNENRDFTVPVPVLACCATCTAVQAFTTHLQFIGEHY